MPMHNTQEVHVRSEENTHSVHVARQSSRKCVYDMGEDEKDLGEPIFHFRGRSTNDLLLLAD